MGIINEIDLSAGNGMFLDTRDIKKSAEGIKIQLHGDQVMGYAYYQFYKNAEGVQAKRVVRSADFPVMENETEDYGGGPQKPHKALYSVAWDITNEKAVIVTLDKVSVIKQILSIEQDPDQKSMTDYGLKIVYNEKATGTEQYKVVKLDSDKVKEGTTTSLKEMTASLKELSGRADLVAFSEGREIFSDSNSDENKDDKF